MPRSQHADETAPWAIYGAISTPVVVTSRDGRVVFLNVRAEAFWGVRTSEVRGRVAWSALGLGPADGADHAAWVRRILSPTLASEAPLPSRAIAADGSEHRIEVTGFWTSHRGRPFAVWTASEVRADTGRTYPQVHRTERDPLTGLATLAHLQQVAVEWSGSRGTVVFFDLDGVEELHAAGGQSAADRALAGIGRALAAEAPPGGLAVRYSDDEFLLLLDKADEAVAADVAGRVIARVAGEHEGPQPLRLGHGTATFAAGSLEAAVRSARDALRERRGVLLRAASGGRIILTRAARRRLQRATAEPEAGEAGTAGVPERRGHRSADADLCFREAFPGTVEQAREFVRFADPAQGTAVVEIGAGAGRVTFDGGLAERIGPRGQLLVTDPSGERLAAARRRAFQLGLGWVCFLQAPVEDLPLASGTADLVLGSVFLHWTEPAEALRAMARVVRPGGRVATCAALRLSWGAAWEESLEPVRGVLAQEGRARPLFAEREEIEAAFKAAGLRIDQWSVAPPQHGIFADVRIALRIAQHSGLVRLHLRDVPEARRASVQQAVEEGIRRAFARPRPPGDTAWEAETVRILAHRPK